MTSALVAALAAVSSAAAIGSAAVDAPLPAKFTLKSSTLTRGTAIEKFLGQVTVDEYGSRESAKPYICLLCCVTNLSLPSEYLNIGPGTNQVQIPVTSKHKQPTPTSFLRPRKLTHNPNSSLQKRRKRCLR